MKGTVAKRSLPNIPADLLLELLSFLSPTHLLASVACVCRSWQKLIQTSRLWKPSFFVLHSRQVPSERTCHTAIVHKNKMYVLGGMDKSNTIHGIKKELAILNFDTMTWHTVTAGVPGLTEHSCIVWRQSLIIFGGYHENNSACCNHLFEGTYLDTPKPAFRQLKANGEEPRARSAHVALLHGDKMYISGGWNCRFTVTFDDLHSFDLKTHTWEQLPPSPHAARAHCGFVYGDAIFLFGGCNNENQSLGDLQRFDIAEQKWCIQSVTGDIPLGRSRCRGVLYHKHFILIGGWNRQVYYDELYVLNVEEMIWTKVGTHSMPAVVQHSVVLNGDRLYSFAGFIRRNQSQLGGPKDKDIRLSDGEHSSDDGSGKKHAHKKKKLDPSTHHAASSSSALLPPHQHTSVASPNSPPGAASGHTNGHLLHNMSSSSNQCGHLGATSSSSSSGSLANGNCLQEGLKLPVHHDHHANGTAAHANGSFDHDMLASHSIETGSSIHASPDHDPHLEGSTYDGSQQDLSTSSSSFDEDTDQEESDEDCSEMEADNASSVDHGPLPANPTPEQQTREDGMGQLCNTLYCYLCFHAVGA